MIGSKKIPQISECRLLISLYPDCSQRKDVLVYFAKFLFRESCVKASYVRAVQKRENEYPTGLRLTGSYNVALPHASPEFVYHNALMVGVLNHPVDFQLMEDPEIGIPVKVVFMFSAVDFDSINFVVNRLTEKILLKPEVMDQIPTFTNDKKLYSFIHPIIFDIN